MSDPSSFAAATARFRRPGPEPQPLPQPRPRRSRTLLVGLPVFAVFAAFSAIVWLAYEHGAQGPPIGEPPLIKAPTLAIKLPPDQAGAPAVADQGEVRDLLTDTPPSGQSERLLPAPERPQAPVTAAEEPDDGSGDAAAVAPPTPDATAPATTGPTTSGATTSGATTSATAVTGPATGGQVTGGPVTSGSVTSAEAVPPPVAAAPPPQTAPAAVQPAPAQAAPAPADVATAPAQVAPAPAKVAPAPAQVAPAPAQVAPAPAQVATAPAQPPRETPLAVERQSTAQTGPEPPSSAPQPTPKEAEAALDALLAEVTGPAEARSTPPAPDGVQPAPSTVSELPPPIPSPARQPAPAAPTQLAPPATASPPAGRGTDVTALAPDRLDTRAPTGAAATTATPRPSSTPTLEPAPNNGVAALEGGYRIQLAAVRDEADARRAWDLYLVDLGPVLRGVQPFIERAETANGTFYRVQIGPFANLQEAESLCDELKRRNASCFVIRR